jgi:Nif-specific regulatory protein
VQGKLLRFLQDRTFERVGGRTTLEADVRVVAATHRDLETAVAEGTFREDLYYRLRVVEMVLPPLRSRGAAEIDSLATHFAGMYAKRYSRPLPRLEPATLAALHAHTWPGNVRELEHWVESAVVLSRDGTIRPEHLPRRVSRESRENGGAVADGREVSLATSLTLEEASRRYALAQLELAGGNRTETARRLGISRNRLARLLGGSAGDD